MRHAPLLLASALVCPTLVACGSDDTTPGPSPDDTGEIARSELARESNPQVSDTAKSALVEGHNAFAFDLYQLIRQDEGSGKNMFFSPTSITVALSMAYAGARGTTADEMASALHYTLPADELFPAFNWLDQELEGRDDAAFKMAADEAEMYGEEAPSRDDFRLHVVNSLWGERTMPIESPFLDTLAVNYGAGVFLSDFKGNPEAERIRINDWVATETLDRIRDLIPQGELTPMTRAVLVNAIHLKLPWDAPFAKADDLSFTRADGTIAVAPAIAREHMWQYTEDNGLQAVLIPLQGYQIQLLIVAPAVGQLDAFEAGLTAQSFDAFVSGMQSNQVILRMPKVNFTTESVRLKSKLQALGMVAPFSEASADFSGITLDEPLHISEVVHKAMLGIDENGVEAAAATAVIAAGSSAPPEPVAFDVDRPYFVGLRDSSTGALLFAGHIVDPTQ